MSDLDREFGKALLSLNDAHLAELASFGIDRAFAVRGLIGVARMSVDGPNYQPDDEGVWGFVTPVRVVDAAKPWLFEDIDPSEVVSDGDLVDLVAWHPCRPRDWALRQDTATYLGCIKPQILAPAPVPVARSPLTWLRAGAVGLCPLVRCPRELQSLLLELPAIEAEDDEHAAQLGKFLRYPISIPPLSVAAKRQTVSAQ